MSTRVILPEEFYDKTSDQLLCQPEPQYPLASLFLSAIGASLPVPAGLGLVGREVMGVNADYSAADKDRLKLAMDLPGELFAVKADFNAAPGNTLRINRPKFANTTYTEASRKVPSGSSISTTAITFGSEQANLTLFRYAGPYDSTNSRVAPFYVDAFDANMGVHNLTKIVGNQLVRDYHRFLDAVYVTIAASASSTLYSDGMTADNDATSAGSFPFSLELMSRTEQTMDEANLPTLADGSRVFMITPQSWKQLKHDPEYEAQAAFHKEFALVYPNYVGSVGKFHVFKSTTLTTTANSSSVNVHSNFAMAPGAFMGGMGRKPRVASSTDDNFGEQAKVVWLADLAFGLADNRFIVQAHSA